MSFGPLFSFSFNNPNDVFFYLTQWAVTGFMHVNKTGFIVSQVYGWKNGFLQKSTTENPNKAHFIQRLEIFELLVS